MILAETGQLEETSEPICIVTKSERLTVHGWEMVTNSETLNPPFRLLPDTGRTYLQWTGSPEDKLKCQGRLIVIQLLCKDSTNPKRPLFDPAIAIRVAGSPMELGIFNY